MNTKRLICIILSITLILSTIPALAIDINGNTGGVGHGPVGSGEADWNWSTGARGRAGYRLSIYFAPVTQDSDPSNPTYDWSQGAVEQVGNTIDVRQDFIYKNNDERTIIRPDVWGGYNAREYTQKGGPLQPLAAFNKGSKMAISNGQMYYYYQFAPEDEAALNDSANYIAAIFNERNLMAPDGAGLTEETFVQDYNELKAQLDTFQTENDKAKEVLASAQAQLEASRFVYLNKRWTIPMPTGLQDADKKGYGITSAYCRDVNANDGLFNYLLNPTILKLLSEATQGNFTPIDFYMGSRIDPGTGEQKYGTYKIIIENTLLTGVKKKGDPTSLMHSLTTSDIIAYGRIKYDYTFSILGQIGVNRITQGLVNTMRLSKPEKDLLEFVGQGDYMGSLLEGGAEPKDVTDAEGGNDEILWGKNEVCDGLYLPGKKIGNYGGTGVITSFALYSYGSTPNSPKSQIFSEIGIVNLADMENSLSNIEIQGQREDFKIDWDSEIDKMTFLSEDIKKELKWIVADYGFTGAYEYLSQRGGAAAEEAERLKAQMNREIPTIKLGGLVSSVLTKSVNPEEAGHIRLVDSASAERPLLYNGKLASNGAVFGVVTEEELKETEKMSEVVPTGDTYGAEITGAPEWALSKRVADAFMNVRAGGGLFRNSSIDDDSLTLLSNIAGYSVAKTNDSGTVEATATVTGKYEGLIDSISKNKDKNLVLVVLPTTIPEVNGEVYSEGGYGQRSLMATERLGAIMSGNFGFGSKGRTESIWATIGDGSYSTELADDFNELILSGEKLVMSGDYNRGQDLVHGIEKSKVVNTDIPALTYRDMISNSPRSLSSVASSIWDSTSETNNQSGGLFVGIAGSSGRSKLDGGVLGITGGTVANYVGNRLSGNGDGTILSPVGTDAGIYVNSESENAVEVQGDSELMPNDVINNISSMGGSLQVIPVKNSSTAQEAIAKAAAVALDRAASKTQSGVVQDRRFINSELSWLLDAMSLPSGSIWGQTLGKYSYTPIIVDYGVPVKVNVHKIDRADGEIVGVTTLQSGVDAGLATRFAVNEPLRQGVYEGTNAETGAVEHFGFAYTVDGNLTQSTDSPETQLSYYVSDETGNVKSTYKVKAVASYKNKVEDESEHAELVKQVESGAYATLDTGLAWPVPTSEDNYAYVKAAWPNSMYNTAVYPTAQEIASQITDEPEEIVVDVYVEPDMNETQLVIVYDEENLDTSLTHITTTVDEPIPSNPWKPELPADMRNTFRIVDIKTQPGTPLVAEPNADTTWDTIKTEEPDPNFDPEKEITVPTGPDAPTNFTIYVHAVRVPDIKVVTIYETTTKDGSNWVVQDVPDDVEYTYLANKAVWRKSEHKIKNGYEMVYVFADERKTPSDIMSRLNNFDTTISWKEVAGITSEDAGSGKSNIRVENSINNIKNSKGKSTQLNDVIYVRAVRENGSENANYRISEQTVSKSFSRTLENISLSAKFDSLTHNDLHEGYYPCGTNPDGSPIYKDYDYKVDKAESDNTVKFTWGVDIGNLLKSGNRNAESYTSMWVIGYDGLNKSSWLWYNPMEIEQHVPTYRGTSITRHFSPKTQFQLFRGLDRPEIASYAPQPVSPEQILPNNRDQSDYSITSNKVYNINTDYSNLKDGRRATYDRKIVFGVYDGVVGGDSVTAKWHATGKRKSTTLTQDGVVKTTGSTRSSTGQTSPSYKEEANVEVEVLAVPDHVAPATVTATDESWSYGKIGGYNMLNGFSKTVPAGSISFYPYVKMMYNVPEDFAAGSAGPVNNVNVLSKRQSNINMKNAVLFGFTPASSGADFADNEGNGNNAPLQITSSLWSTHARAAEAIGKNGGKVLAGGLDYQLANKKVDKHPDGTVDDVENPTRPTFAIKDYTWVASEDTQSALAGGSGYVTQNEAVKAHKEAVSELISSLEKKPIYQHVKWISSLVDWDNSNKKFGFNSLRNSRTDKKIDKTLTKAGTKLDWYSGTVANPIEEDAKYWFNNIYKTGSSAEKSGGINRTAAKAVVDKAEFYTIRTDFLGNVELGYQLGYDTSTSATTVYTKWSSNDDILKDLVNIGHNWADVEAKTGLVSQYLSQVHRNLGMDLNYVGLTFDGSSGAITGNGALNNFDGGSWYNEAFKPMQIVVQTSVIQVGMDDGTEPYTASLYDEPQPHVNVLSMKFAASGQNSTGDIYKNYNKSWFEAEPATPQFSIFGITFGGENLVGSEKVDLNLRSNNFYIPNATVYDND